MKERLKYFTLSKTFCQFGEGPEYVFESEERFSQLEHAGSFLISKSLLAGEKIHHHGVLRWALNKSYLEQNIECDYDYVVYNDKTPESCVEQIIHIIKGR
ncbi:hypothetical protein COU49_02740 [Candidatus Nomurabacteria bacterium CG10_big_fil_rev_8_21_14_0_10_35_16]|uniref:Uncharacterized protein n=1 Tax=Candidatus Nomurabacteria bacterium CG10_big_fil_rev_8_21_14_0_10_35_16 TaxID=1974731 RepID=A0A2H0TAP7_9BACT|nr:MAG: hypothetical protein COU49_02740 [Candidatus Nomurabacteria bacterium CG10_big_fil_rev_8_21_14_0_10_35_16]